jgi:hypothetical protein
VKVITAAAAMLVATLLVSCTSEPVTPDRPPGVPPEQWIAIGKTAGFVVVREQRPTARLNAPAVDTVEGHLMVLQGGVWRNVELLSLGTGFTPAGLRVARDNSTR